MERCQKAGFVSPITSKITLTKKKGEKERARREKGGEEKLKNAMIAFLVSIMATMEITVFGQKKIFGRKGPLGDNVFKNPTTYMYVCKSLFKHGKSSVKLKVKPKLITTALHGCRVGYRYISYLLDISLKMINRCSIF